MRKNSIDKIIAWMAAFAVCTAGCSSESEADKLDTAPAGDAALGDGAVADSAGSDAKKGDAGGKDIQYADSPLFPELPPNTPPAATWLSPAEGAVLAANLPSLCTIEVSDSETAVAQLGLSMTITDPPQQAAVVTGVVGKLVTLRLPGLKPGPHKLTLTVTDGMGGTVSIGRQVTAQSPPGAPQVAIEPAVPHRGQDLQATVATALQAADQLQYKWHRNNIKVKGLAGALVPGHLLYAGDSWRVDVVVVQGEWQSPVGSAEVVVANGVPTAVALALSPTEPTLSSTVQCQIASPATDTDGDALTYSYAWTLNGVALPDAPTLAWLALAAAGPDGLKAAIPAKIGDVLGCTVTASDGVAVGPPASATATLGQADVCSTALNPCSPIATCIPSDTLAVKCACKDGFVGNGTQCFDIDECAIDSAGCDLYADCSNTQGSYACTCLWGYSGNGKQCSDIDECAQGSAFCDLAADCSNTAGSYACTCQSGFEGTGVVCTDINECAAPASLCDPIAACVNLPGSYQCNCPDGYAMVGQTCVQP